MEQHEHWSLLSAYVDGELTGPERSAVDAHLAGCPSCREELTALGEAKRRLASLPRRALPADLLADIEERLTRPSFADLLRALLRTLVHKPGVWVPAGATAAFLLGGGLWWGLAARQDEELPLEPLLAAHSHYASVGLVPNDAELASEFSVQLEDYHEPRR